MSSETRHVRIVLTGPSGWIGAAFLSHFGHLFGSEWPARVLLFGSTAREHVTADGARCPIRALSDIRPADVEGALVIHLAYLTREKADRLGDAVFRETNTAIDDAVLSAVKAGRPKAIFVASSGAASMAEVGCDAHPYGLCKLEQEDRFLRFGASSGVSVLAGRIFNIAGAHINKLSSYAISAFLSEAFESRRISIAATVPVYRSYLHVNDLCRLVLATLESGNAPDRAIDLCGSEVVEMMDIAREAARATELSEAAIRRGPIDFERPSIYLGNATDAKTLALRHGVRLIDFAGQVTDTAEFIRHHRRPMAITPDRPQNKVNRLI